MQKFYIILGFVFLLVACGGSDNGSAQLSSTETESETGAGEDTGTATAPLQAIKDRYEIDGEINFDALTTGSATLNLTDISSNIVQTSEVNWGYANDDRHIYLAFRWSDNTQNNLYDNTGPVNFDGIKLMFDIDGDGSYEDNEDARTVIAALSGSQYIDEHKAAGDQTDAHANGRAKLKYDANMDLYSAEFLLPFKQDQMGEDGIITNNSYFNFLLYDDIRLSPSFTGNLAQYSDSTDTTQWISFELTEDGPYAHPVMPDDLTGLIIFTSAHETTNNEIYSLDPATNTVEKITHLPNLFKENVSLSHDRTRIAFHGTPDKNDYTAYEIYTINIDGTNLQKLTNNSILDGHPGWSLDDSMIVYVSFRGPSNEENVILMSDVGVEIANLTPANTNDNDPDFLPNGNIIFKTDRFGTGHQSRLALMDTNGANVQQLTDVANSSDHDAVGHGGTVIFERFTKSTHYATDPEALFVPWHIVEVDIVTLEEQRLVTDEWVNWLPVYSPSGEYILYLKTMGYTGMFLMGRDGVELGQMAEHIDEITYVDWK